MPVIVLSHFYYFLSPVSYWGYLFSFSYSSSNYFSASCLYFSSSWFIVFLFKIVYSRNLSTETLNHYGYFKIFSYLYYIIKALCFFVLSPIYYHYYLFSISASYTKFIISYTFSIYSIYFLSLKLKIYKLKISNLYWFIADKKNI